jgi:serine/threonine protein kinase
MQTFSDPENVYLVTEYCSGGELWERCKFVGEPEYRAKVYFSQLVDALSYIHRMGIVHRDLKAENVLLSHDLQCVKLCDFGSSRDLFNPQITGSGTPNPISRESSFSHYVGTSNFLSPEAITNSENDALSDIWSLGCLFYQVLCGIPPFVAGSDYLIYIRIRAGDLQFPTHGLSESARLLIKSIIQLERSKRTSLESFKTHEFFRDCPQLVPPYNDDDSAIRSIVRHNQPRLVGETSQYFSDRLKLSETVAKWRESSAPGIGLAMVEHLIPHVPELQHLSNK